MGDEWQGFCMGGCVGMSCEDMIDLVGGGPCYETEEPAEDLDGQPVLLDLSAPTSETSLMALAKATVAGRATFEKERGVVVLHSCSGNLLTGQVPLSGAERTRFEAILARSP